MVKVRTESLGIAFPSDVAGVSSGLTLRPGHFMRAEISRGKCGTAHTIAQFVKFGYLLRTGSSRRRAILLISAVQSKLTRTASRRLKEYAHRPCQSVWQKKVKLGSQRRLFLNGVGFEPTPEDLREDRAKAQKPEASTLTTRSSIRQG
jgi:hypothetical protein